MKGSKTRHIIVSDKNNPAKYLSSQKLSVPEIQTLFRLRSSTVNLKDNHKSSHRENPWFQTCFLFSETQEHILECTPIRNKVKQLNLDFKSVNYQVLFWSLLNQEKLAKVYKILLEARNDLLKTSPSPDVDDPSTGGITEMQLTNYCNLSFGI